MTIPGATDIEGPVSQSIDVAAKVMRVGIALLALGWLTSNIRQVPPDAQALVLRFGRIVAQQPSGLVLAWPRPIDQVVLVPGPQRQMETRIEAGTANAPGLIDPVALAAGESPPADAGSFLTGDGGVVLLRAQIIWQVTNPTSFYLAGQRLDPALRRAFMGAALSVAAQRTMDDFLVVRPERTQTDPAFESRRQALRQDLKDAINARLAALDPSTGGLGISVARVDVEALLPPATKLAFDAVLEAAQRAEQGLAAARTEAEHTRQTAVSDRDRILADAQASAEERVGSAQVQVATINGLAAQASGPNRAGLVARLYRERIAALLRNAGAVVSLDPGQTSHLILPGGKP